MNAVVVYESLYGNTAAIARAIADGLGPQAQALSTADATPEMLAGVTLIVAGAPVHSMNLPTEQSRAWARDGSLGPGGAPPDLSHPPMRAWLAGLPEGQGHAAAFDTRVQAWYGRGAASQILRGLKGAGYRPLAKGRGFYVSGHPIKPTASGTLREGEIEQARQWGAELARAMEREQLRIPPMPIQIRPYSPADREYVLSLVPRFSGFELPAWRQASQIDAANRAHLENALQEPEPDAAIYVAVDESNRPLGFIHLQTRSDYFSGEKCGYIADVAVDSAAEGQGIGRMLLETAENWAYEKSYGLLGLEVFSGNERARRIYEQLGYHPEVIKYVKPLKLSQ